MCVEPGKWSVWSWLRRILFRALLPTAAARSTALPLGLRGTWAIAVCGASNRCATPTTVGIERLAGRAPGVAAGTAIAIWPETPGAGARLPNREVWKGAHGHLTFRAWQRGSDERTVGRTFVLFGGRHRRWFRDRLDRRLDVYGLILVLLGHGHGRARGLSDHTRRQPVQDVLIERPSRRLLLTLRRNPGLFVLVLGFARHASRLPHFLTDQSHDGVIGDSSLARAVIVQDVTKPKLALLHQTSERGIWLELGDGRRSKSLAEP
jgi:hypothetical protein